jgi:hypothetical protein
MSVFAYLRLDIHHERIDIKSKDLDLQSKKDYGALTSLPEWYGNYTSTGCGSLSEQESSSCVAVRAGSSSYGNLGDNALQENLSAGVRA